MGDLLDKAKKAASALVSVHPRSTLEALSYVGGPSGVRQYLDERDMDKEVGRQVDRLGTAARDSMRQEADRQSASQRDTSSLPKYHKGGTVRTTGPVRLLKGERVLNRKEARSYPKRGRSRS